MSPHEQLELTSPPAPKVDKSDVEKLIDILYGEQRWMTASEIQLYIENNYPFKWAEWTNRDIRAIASASEGRIISGQKGYKLTVDATIQEVQHAAAWLRHQATEMNNRALQIDRVYHRKQPLTV